MKKETALRLITEELARAQDSYPAKFNSCHEGYAVLLEEVDELWEAIKCNSEEGVDDEAVQVAAMALRFLIDCCFAEELNEEEK